METNEDPSLPCVCATLRRTTRRIARVYDRALAPTGLRTTQFSILARLDALGPRPVSELAGRLGMDRSTLTRELRPLEQRGLTTAAAGEDRRQRVVSLTPDGLAALEAAFPYWRAVQADVGGRFGVERTGALLGELRSLSRATA